MLEIRLWFSLTPCISLLDLQRLPSSSQTEEAKTDLASDSQRSPKTGHYSTWAPEQEPPESLHAENLEMQEYDYSCEEQMVPVSVSYQPYRSELR